jgi:PAS domain-containing protein
VLKSMDKAAMLSTVEIALRLHEVNVQVRTKGAVLSAVMDAVRDTIVMLDGQGNVVFWNPAAGTGLRLLQGRNPGQGPAPAGCA